jgi:hypothetical protein
MNERIQKLIEQASYNIVETNGWPIVSNEFNKEKFAQLIISECAGVCEDYRGTEWGKAAECIGDSIKEHFGVEE